jgi:hypothetical protein
LWFLKWDANAIPIKQKSPETGLLQKRKYY